MEGKIGENTYNDLAGRVGRKTNRGHFDNLLHNIRMDIVHLNVAASYTASSNASVNQR